MKQGQGYSKGKWEIRCVHLCTHHCKNSAICWWEAQGTGSRNAKAHESVHKMHCFLPLRLTVCMYLSLCVYWYVCTVLQAAEYLVYWPEWATATLQRCRVVLTPHERDPAMAMSTVCNIICSSGLPTVFILVLGIIVVIITIITTISCATHTRTHTYTHAHTHTHTHTQYRYLYTVQGPIMLNAGARDTHTHTHTHTQTQTNSSHGHGHGGKSPIPWSALFFAPQLYSTRYTVQVATPVLYESSSLICSLTFFEEKTTTGRRDNNGQKNKATS